MMPFAISARAYDVEVQGLQGISTASDVSVRDVQRIVDLLVKAQNQSGFRGNQRLQTLD